MIELKKLNYELGDLEPFIDKETVDIHHNKHHQAYVNNLNGLLEKAGKESMELEEVLLNLNNIDESVRGGINNNAGGVYMHDAYFEQFSKAPKAVEGELKEQIEICFGSFEEMIDTLKQKAATQFGSGWSALVVDKASKKLEIVQIPNQDVAGVLVKGLVPIAVLDVWEHAYYLKYQNRRPEYLDNVVKAIDWEIVGNKYSEVK